MSYGTSFKYLVFLPSHNLGSLSSLFLKFFIGFYTLMISSHIWFDYYVPIISHFRTVLF